MISGGEWYGFTRSDSAEFRDARSATVPAAIHCGHRSPTIPTNFSKRTFPCAWRNMKRSPTAADRGFILAATGVEIVTASSNRISIHDDRWFTVGS
jgi:hypothetical protein